MTLVASLQVCLHPLNEIATQQGALRDVVADTQGGRGTFTLQWRAINCRPKPRAFPITNRDSAACSAAR
jgi:hypothetical protein